jgi:hypothetical protein
MSGYSHVGLAPPLNRFSRELPETASSVKHLAVLHCAPLSSVDLISAAALRSG